jgi:hypothetical protein
VIEISYLNSDEVSQITERSFSHANALEFPAASVSAVELKLT